MSLLVDHTDADRIAGTPASFYEYRHVTRKVYLNDTPWSVNLRDRRGIVIHVENTRLINANAQQGSIPVETIERGKFSITETVTMPSRGLEAERDRLNALKDRGLLTRYQIAWREALNTQLATGYSNYPHSLVHVTVKYTYDITVLVGDVLNVPKCIYLREHDIVMDIDPHGGLTDANHPCDLATNTHIDSELLGERYNDDDTTIIGLKLVENKEDGYMADRFMNLGGTVIRLQPTQDKLLGDGLNLVIRNKRLPDKHLSRNFRIDKADEELPLYSSMEAALARGDEREYYRRQTEIRKATHDTMLYRQRMETECIKRKNDLHALVERRRQDHLKMVRDRLARTQAERTSEIQASQSRLRERGDILKTVLGLITGVLGFVTLIAKAK